MKEAADNRSKGEVRAALLDQVTSLAEVEIPQIMIDNKIAGYLNQMSQRLEQQGLNLEQYLEYAGQSMEELRDSYKVQAEKAVKTDLALENIAKLENIEVSEEELNEEIEKMAKYYNQEINVLKSFLASQDNLQGLRQGIQLDKTVDFLVNEAKIETVPDNEKEEGNKEE